MATEASGKAFVVVSSTLLACMLLSHHAPAAEAGRLLSAEDDATQIDGRVMKTVKVASGGVIDCIDIYRQPAFDHPLLQNHTIQMKPSGDPPSMMSERGSEPPSEVHEVLDLEDVCPEGSIPIERTRKTKAGFKKAETMRFGEEKRATANGHEHSVIRVGDGRKFNGASADINVWNPKTNPDEFSLSQMWMISDDDTNTAEAGWTVNPLLYGDNQTRHFVYWTRDGYKNTGCYNLDCPGFVQTNKDTLINSVIKPYSVYQGDQFVVNIAIRKDLETGNWWLYRMKVPIGYWPVELLPGFRSGASAIEFGGEITNTKSGAESTTTQMGSGHFPEEGFGKASFFRNVLCLDAVSGLGKPENFQVIVENPNCYGLRAGESGDGHWGSYFYYGGPGKSDNCP